MKTKSLVVTVATIMLIAHHLGAQGTVNFSTLGVTISDDNGEPIPSGNIFTAGLFYAPVGTTDSFSFEQVGAATGFIGPGIIIAGARQVTDDRTGPFANLQVSCMAMRFYVVRGRSPVSWCVGWAFRHPYD